MRNATRWCMTPVATASTRCSAWCRRRGQPATARPASGCLSRWIRWKAGSSARDVQRMLLAFPVVESLMKIRFAALALFLVTSIAPAVHAQSAPLHIIVPFAPGGAQDVIGRYIGSKLGPLLGVPVVVENKAGAGGVIAADAVAKASPDGNTILLATGGAISIAPHLSPKLAYDPRKDLMPVAMIADTPMTLSVRAQSPYTSVADVLRDAKARPGQVSFASTGNGTISHL